jgi:hypothetical protein
MKNMLFTTVLVLILACMNTFPAFCQGPKNRNLYPADTAYDKIQLFNELCPYIYFLNPLTWDITRVDSVIRAYTISSKDLVTAMGLDTTKLQKGDIKYEYIRAYIGLDTPSNKFKLFLVPVAGYKDSSDGGKDVMLDSTGGGPTSYIYEYRAENNLNPRDGLKNKYVLDLNSPCPNFCSFITPFPTPNSNNNPKPRSNNRKTK